MPRGKSFEATLAEGEQIMRVWEANQTFVMGEITRASYRALLDNYIAKRAEVDDKRSELARAVDELNDLAGQVNAGVVRARSGIRAFFGPDSAQYEQAGGIRQSERKPPKKKKPE